MTTGSLFALVEIVFKITDSSVITLFKGVSLLFTVISLYILYCCLKCHIFKSGNVSSG